MAHPEESPMKQIATAFLEAKRRFAPALKDKANPAFKSKYADLSACLDAVNDALLEAGICLYQETFEDTTGITVETVLLHSSGEALRGGKLHVPAAKQDPQGYGSALTYARRYSLMTTCGISAEDDDGNAATFISADQAAQIRATIQDQGVDPEALLDWIGNKIGSRVRRIEHIPASVFNAVIASLAQSKAKAMAKATQTAEEVAHG